MFSSFHFRSDSRRRGGGGENRKSLERGEGDVSERMRFEGFIKHRGVCMLSASSPVRIPPNSNSEQLHSHPFHIHSNISDTDKMVHAPEVTDYVKQAATKMDAISDEIDEVNVQKGKPTFDGESEFDAAKDKAGFRQYEAACDRVKNFYAVCPVSGFYLLRCGSRVHELTLVQEQHRKQTLSYNLAMRKEYTEKTRARMGIWQAMEMLNTLVDESDPDTSVGQIEHLLQTAEAIRRDGKPDWMQLTGLIHDLGKLLCFFGADGQWDVVGDTFVVGCKFSDKIIYPETFKENPDYNDEKLQTENGIYEAGCGLDNVLLSWGHDEYLYHVVKSQSTRKSFHILLLHIIT